jgi:predicted membrane chloride channel (bestrophin family)
MSLQHVLTGYKPSNGGRFCKIIFSPTSQKISHLRVMPTVLQFGLVSLVACQMVAPLEVIQEMSLDCTPFSVIVVAVFLLLLFLPLLLS